MEKPNEKSTLKYMKEYVRAHKLNHPQIKLSMKKAEMSAGLKAHGHWGGAAKPKEKEFPIGQRFGSKKFTKSDKPMEKPKAKKTRSKEQLERAKAMKAKRSKPKSKLDKGQKDFLAGIY
tara:strand:+ start:175 stop:531 length:357 start_codon:yes stop_codon:yes gene_type:complete